MKGTPHTPDSELRPQMQFSVSLGHLFFGVGNQHILSPADKALYLGEVDCY